jgi:hypothetical protein
MVSGRFSHPVFTTAPKKRSSTTQAHDAYQSASETAISELPATHPVRLGRLGWMDFGWWKKDVYGINYGMNYG